jgi:hypothetical protein
MCERCGKVRLAYLYTQDPDLTNLSLLVTAVVWLDTVGFTPASDLISARTPIAKRHLHAGRP